MEIDRFITRHQLAWIRLEQLTLTARSGIARLAPGELDELVGLYQRASSHLSYARVTYRDPALTARLTRLVAEANGVIYSRRSRSLRSLTTFFALTFPGAVWDCRRFVAASAALLFVPAIAIGAWLANSDEAMEAAWPDELRTAMVEREFEDYYSSGPAAGFAAEVQTNNIQVSFLAFALGALLVVPAAVVLVINGQNVGYAAGLFHYVGEWEKFYGLILPHGLLELTAVVIAGGAGMRLGWSVVAPGERSRRDAFTFEARRSVTVILGLMAAFVVAGLIEAYVTPSSLPTAARVGIGVAVETAFLLYIAGQGRRAAVAGIVGVLGELDRRWEDEPTLTPLRRELRVPSIEERPAPVTEPR